MSQPNQGSLEGIEPPYRLITEPLTVQDCDIDGWIRCVVPVSLSKIHAMDFDEFLEHLSELAVGNRQLLNPEHRMVGCDLVEQEIHFEIEGDASVALDLNDVEQEDDDE